MRLIFGSVRSRSTLVDLILKSWQLKVMVSTDREKTLCAPEPTFLLFHFLVLSLIFLSYADIMAIRCKGSTCEILNYELSDYEEMLPMIERLSRVRLYGKIIFMFSKLAGETFKFL
jgi:hypothetical protein